MANAQQDSNPQVAFDLNAYNAAFYELGLRWHWDLATYESLLKEAPDASGRLSKYLSHQHPHLLRAYDVDFLSAAIEEKKAKYLQSSAASGSLSGHFDWAHSRGAELGS
jgi:hypothetical protein